jgi:hypothetical protein
MEAVASTLDSRLELTITNVDMACDRLQNLVESVRTRLITSAENAAHDAIVDVRQKKSSLVNRRNQLQAYKRSALRTRELRENR